jgi:predicted nuclease of predicted toxin-antitoxin system
MRFLVDENVSSTVLAGLRAKGFEVLAVKESMRGAGDVDILRRAQTERRIVVTHDKDFGELAYRLHMPADSGVVLFRLSGDSPEGDNWRVLAVLQSRDDWPGHFAVVTDDRVRMRPLP